MSIRIVTDSACDLPPDVVQAYGIAVVPMHINIGTHIGPRAVGFVAMQAREE
ncbi:MAG: DegV family protein [Anaerolineae bacterium]